MPSNATVATRWTMLPLLTGKNSGKSHPQQEQSENKAANDPVVQNARAAVGQYESVGDWMSRAWLAVGVLALPWAAGGIDGWSVRASSAQEATPAQQIWTVPEIGALPNNDYGRLVRRGRDLITATYAHIGPEVPDRAKRFAGNNLACGNCHLQAGTKKFGIPLFGLLEKYPRYSARSGAPITIEDRFNACMTRSMNGRPLPV